MPPFMDAATADAVKSIPLLLEFTCRVCKTTKNKECFSKNETKNYQLKKVKNTQTDGVSALLRCRSCAGEQVHELLCEGQCGLWKPLSQFSKTQRRNGSRWCEECILWKESLEPGHVTAAAPNAPLAPDEDDNVVGEAGHWMYDPEAGNSDDEFEDFASFASVPVQQYGNLSLADGDNVSGTSVSGSVRYGYIPPHLRGQSSSTSVKAPSTHLPPHLCSDQSSTSGTASLPGYVPPHLRGTDMRSTSSVSNPYETSDSGRTVSQAGVPQSALQAGAIYNAYDNTGRPPVTKRVPPASTVTNSSMASSQGSPQIAQQSKNNGGWAKSVGIRKPAPQYIPSGHTRQRNNNDSESDDEM